VVSVPSKPESETGMLITWPLPFGREEPEDPPLDELPPQPAASTTTTSGAAASAHIRRILMPRPRFPDVALRSNIDRIVTEPNAAPPHS
jgi:hypothetical protein